MLFKTVYIVLALTITTSSTRVFVRQTTSGLTGTPTVAVSLLSDLFSVQTPSATSSDAISADGSITDLPLETPGLQMTTPDAISADGTITDLPLETPGLQSTAAATSSASSNHGGAIAGGVVAAIVVAAIAAILLIRYRNKRSSSHWRNRIRGGAAGPLGDTLDFKSDAAGNPGTQNIGLDDHKSPIASPVTAKFTTPLIYPPRRQPKAESIEMQQSPGS